MLRFVPTFARKCPTACNEGIEINWKIQDILDGQWGFPNEEAAEIDVKTGREITVFGARDRYDQGNDSYADSAAQREKSKTRSDMAALRKKRIASLA